MLSISLVWRLPSLWDPPWVNDEGTYFAVAQAMAHGYRLYTQVWENKPPGIYLVYAAVYHLAGPSLVTVRVLAALAALAIVFLVALISNQYAPRGVTMAAALTAGLLLGVPFLEGTTANAEIFLALCTALAAWLVAAERRATLAGGAAGVAILFKAVAGFDALAIVLWLLSGRRSAVPRFLAGLIGVVLIAVLLAWQTQILPAMLRDALLYDIGYVGHGTAHQVPWLLVLKLVILGVLALYLHRRPFPYLWLAFATAGALISGRIFGHYFIQVVAPLCISLAHLFRNQTWQVRRVVIVLPAVFLAIGLLTSVAGWSLAAGGHDSILARRLQYYANFARFAFRLEPYAVYRNQIDDHVARNIQIADTLRHVPPGKLLVWGNIPWVYVLSDRLPATPYTSAFRQPPIPGETASLQEAIRRSGIVVVVISPPLPPLGSATNVLSRQYRIVVRIDNATIYVPRSP